MNPEPEPHLVLGVGAAATPEEIEQAFRRLVRAHHPDAGGEHRDDQDRLRAVIAAHAALREAQRRQRDAEAVGAQPPEPPPPETSRSRAASPSRETSQRPRSWPVPQPAIRVGPVRWRRAR